MYFNWIFKRKAFTYFYGIFAAHIRCLNLGLFLSFLFLTDITNILSKIDNNIDLLVCNIYLICVFGEHLELADEKWMDFGIGNDLSNLFDGLLMKKGIVLRFILLHLGTIISIFLNY